MREPNDILAFEAGEPQEESKWSMQRIEGKWYLSRNNAIWEMGTLEECFNTLQYHV